MNGIRSVLLDNSFVTRLLKTDDPFHENVVDYFQYFLDNNIILYLSTVVVGEYAVADNPDHLLALNAFQILEYDYGDAKLAGDFYAFLKQNTDLKAVDQRAIVINDLKLFAQIQNRKIDAFATKDKKSLKMINPLKESRGLKLDFIDLTIPLKERLSLLF